MKDRIKIEDYEKGITIDEYEDTIQIDLCYSNVTPPKKIQYVGVGISHVRASDGIRISYDYERDGYIIEQPIQMTGNMKWREVAFIQSWALEEEQKINDNLD